jgi:amidohydrolase
MKNFRPQAETLREEMIARRRDFHQHPEIAFEEVRTAGIVAQTLSDLGLEVQTGVGKTGVVAVLDGDQPGPTVMVRADMDALPVNEQNEVDYRSQTPNRMHACGHDGHTTIALAAARMLSAQRAEIHGRVKFVFQPAEEIGLGAKAMINDGVLTSPTPEVTLGLHLWNELPFGEVAVTPGPFMAGCDVFTLQVKGRGGHAGMPDKTADPVLATAHIITALQSIVSRNVSPLDTAVVSVTQLQGSDAPNIIPDQVTVRGTFRTTSHETRALVVKRAQEIIHGTAEMMGCTASLEIEQLSPPVVNDASVARRIKQVFTQVAPELHYREDVRTMAAEDVSFFLEQAPGLYFFVGSADANRGLNYPHHHPRFDFDEEALVVGASLLASAVASYVMPGDS